MVYIYKTSHLLQHNSRKAPNTQFKVGSDNLRVQNTICTENGSTTQKAIFTRITTIPENAQVVQTGGLEPVVKLRKQHNYVKPAISEYKWNCEGLVDSQPGQSKATRITYLFSTPSYLREATWSQCTSSLLYVEGVHRRSLADWLTAGLGPEQWV